MSDGLYVTTSDFTKLMKKISFLEEYILNQAVAKAALKNKWVNAETAKQLLGVKETKFKSIRNDGEIVWRYKNGNRGVEVLLKSIEDYKSKTSSKPLLQT